MRRIFRKRNSERGQWRDMTDAENMAFDKAFAEMDNAFVAMDQAFDAMGKMFDEIKRRP